MGLDFVLAKRDYRYLPTEREKVNYFSGALGISLLALPYKRYVSPKSQSTTTRYFVDKYPLFLSEINPTEPRFAPTFCFVDEGSLTLAGFETYLQQYSALWRELKRFQIIFVADSQRLFRIAERRFASFIGGFSHDSSAPLTARLVIHFEARLLYEKGDFSSFSREKLVRLRNERKEFSGTNYENSYAEWKAFGARAVTSGALPIQPTKATFSTYFLDQNYDFFGKTEQHALAIH